MLGNDLPLLSLLIWVPILGAIIVLLMGDEQRRVGQIKWFTLLVSVASLLLSVMAYQAFDPALSTMQLQESWSWIPQFHVNYALGIDGIALPLILLTSLTTVIVVIAGWQVITTQVGRYMACFLFMQGLMCGVFEATDALLFYVFWEAMLVPMFLIIGIWGGPNRIYATIKFFLYTFLGSVLMLVALLYLYNKTQSFALADLQAVKIGIKPQIWIFFAFLLAFAVKVPMWPVHTWLPDAHVEAPTGGSVVLAAIMLKMGGYGFLRFSLPIVPDACAALSWLVILLSLIAVVYIGFVAIVQQDMKKLIAYSSIAHMGFVTLGFFAIYAIFRNTGRLDAAVMGMEGGMMQMISHGFISAALFLCVGVLYDRMHSRKIADYGGVANTMPVFAALNLVFIMANSGLPGTSGFVGEFLVILSAFQANLWIAVLAATILILGPAYNLWMYKRVVYGSVANAHVAELKDVDSREFFMLGVLAVLVFIFGVWPAPIFEMMHSSVQHLLQQVLITKI